jgi:hypothetical protein
MPQDLITLVEALDVWKKEAQQKLSEQLAIPAVEQSPPATGSSARRETATRRGRSGGISYANQGGRQSQTGIELGRIHEDSPSLFVSETGSESEPDHTERHALSPRLSREQSVNEAGTRSDPDPDLAFEEPSLVLAQEESSVASYDDDDASMAQHDSGASMPPEELHELVFQPHESSPEQDLMIDDYQHTFFEEAMAAGYTEQTSFAGQRERSTGDYETHSMDGVEYGCESDDAQEKLIDHQLVEQTVPLVQRTPSFARDPDFESYFELARRSRFRLQHTSADDVDHAQGSRPLLPLAEEVPLTTELIHCLLYMLLPPPLHILEASFDDIGEEFSPSDGNTENFAMIVRRPQGIPPLVLLGKTTTKILYIIDSETADLSFLRVFLLSLSGWTTEYIDVSLIALL